MGEGKGYSKIAQALDKLEAKDGILPGPLKLLRQITALQAEADERIEVRAPVLTAVLIEQCLSQGRPLLQFSDIDIDWTLAAKLADKAAALFAAYSGVPGDKLPAMTAGELKEIAKAWYERRELPPDRAGSEDMVELVISTALKPYLSQYAGALVKSVNQERWRRGYCPVCGGSPDFSYLDKERGARWFLCSRCDAEWLFQRLQCPVCGTQDQNLLAFFSDEKGLYRVNVCEKCHCYLKAIDLRVAEGEVVLSLERIVTLDMDRQVMANGYVSCEQARKLNHTPGIPEAVNHG